MTFLPENSSTALAAWWGAVVATLVLLWDVYKHLASGPRLTIEAQANRIMLGERRTGQREKVDGTWTVVTVANRGTQPTTLTFVGFEFFSSPLRRVLRRPTTSFFAFPHDAGQPIPFTIEPGGRWMGLFKETEGFPDAYRSGILTSGVKSTASNRLVRCRVAFPPAQQITATELW